MKKLICTLLCVMILFLLCACSNSKDNNLIDDFIEYHSENKNINDNGAMLSENDVDIMLLSLEKEKDKSSPNVVLSIQMIGNDAAEYNWMNLSPDERKSEMKSYGEMVIEYAKENGWSNHYYLYVVMSYAYTNYVVYDYETDVIWIPKNEAMFMSMYEQFSTFNYNNLEDTEEGREFLLNNGLATIKHNELETVYYSLGGYSVYISSEGEFKSNGKNESTAY